MTLDLVPTMRSVGNDFDWLLLHSGAALSCWTATRRRSVDVPGPQEKPSADRMVAEWMVRMGGSVVLEGQRKPIFDLADLPATDFRIHALNFTGITMYAASLQDELAAGCRHCRT